jgi:hypothetical protein
VAFRLSASSLLGVDPMTLRTTAADLSISKGFRFITPYAGVGQVHVRSCARVLRQNAKVQGCLPIPPLPPPLPPACR